MFQYTVNSYLIFVRVNIFCEFMHFGRMPIWNNKKALWNKLYLYTYPFFLNNGRRQLSWLIY
jgi:hypothetical protein